MSANGCGPDGTSGANTITLAWNSPTCGVLVLPQVNLPALAHDPFAAVRGIACFKFVCPSNSYIL